MFIDLLCLLRVWTSIMLTLKKHNPLGTGPGLCPGLADGASSSQSKYETTRPIMFVMKGMNIRACIN